MKVSIAKTSGFCMGVRRAVDMVLDVSDTCDGPIKTLGPLIHNPQVLSLLAEKNITVMNAPEKTGHGHVLIRAHGVPPATVEELKQAGYTVVDATCPRVIKVQTIISRYARQGFTAIIIGDKDHPEVTGLLGFAEDRGMAVNTLEALQQLPRFDQAIIVAQTTQSTVLFEEITEWAETHLPHYKVFNTICPSTQNRQAETERLAGAVDAMIVVGGHNSGNTRRLAQIAEESGKPAYHIETSEDMDFSAVAHARRIGITAGASTPNWIINKIYRDLEATYYKSKGPLARQLFQFQRLLLLTNVYLAVGAGFLCYVASLLRHADPFFSHIAIAVLYIFSMHTLNRLTGIDEDHYNDPYRAVFYEKNLVLLAALAIAAGATGLLVAFTLGPIPFLMLLIMSVLGLSYNLNLLPESFHKSKARRIKDIPGSKTILISVAWGVVVCAFPAVASGELNLSAIISTIWLTGIVFVRTAFFDIIDMQGDRLAGKETIPILIGADRTVTLLHLILWGLFVILLLSGLAGTVSSLGYPLLLVPITSGLLLVAYKKRGIYSGARLEFLVESQFVLAGLVGLLWSALA